jgi:hypothetical protein
MYANKEVGVQILNRRSTPGSYKGEVAISYLLRRLTHDSYA